MDSSANEIRLEVVPLVVEQTTVEKALSASQRYYRKNKEKIVERNKQRVLEKYHNNPKYQQNLVERQEKKRLMEEKKSSRVELREAVERLRQLKREQIELLDKEYLLRTRLRDVMYDLKNKTYKKKKSEEEPEPVFE
jgi:hypothetical protein